MPRLPPESPTDASAYWLDRQRLQWPGQVADDGALFKLYHATNGGITAGVGSAVSGTDGAMAISELRCLWWLPA